MNDEKKPNGFPPIPPQIAALGKYIAIISSAFLGALGVTDAYGPNRTGSILVWLWSLTGWQPPLPHDVAANIIIFLVALGFIILAFFFLRK